MMRCFGLFGRFWLFKKNNREIKKCKSEDDAAPETEKSHLLPDS